MIRDTSIEDGDNPGGIGIHPASNHIYIDSAMTGEVIGIDGSSNEIKATASLNGIPSEIGVNPATNRIYVTSTGSEVTVIAVE